MPKMLWLIRSISYKWYKFFFCLSDYEDAISGYELKKSLIVSKNHLVLKGLSFQINMSNSFEKNNVAN